MCVCVYMFMWWLTLMCTLSCLWVNSLVSLSKVQYCLTLFQSGPVFYLLSWHQSHLQFCLQVAWDTKWVQLLNWGILGCSKIVICILYQSKLIHVIFYGVFYKICAKMQTALCALLDYMFDVSSTDNQRCIVRVLLWCCIQWRHNSVGVDVWRHQETNMARPNWTKWLVSTWQAKWVAENSRSLWGWKTWLSDWPITWPWKRHDDILNWKRFPRYLALCDENPLVTSGFPSQRASNTGFAIFFDISLNQRINRSRFTRDLRCRDADFDVTVMLHMAIMDDKLWPGGNIGDITNEVVTSIYDSNPLHFWQSDIYHKVSLSLIHIFIWWEEHPVRSAFKLISLFVSVFFVIH